MLNNGDGITVLLQDIVDAFPVGAVDRTAMHANIVAPDAAAPERPRPASGETFRSWTPIYPVFIRSQPKRRGRISAVLDGPNLRVCCRVSGGTDAREIPHVPEGSARLHNDRISLARGSARSANAVPGTGAAAQRGHRGLETGDESTTIGALRSIISCLLGRAGDAQLRR
jgi:hypothetical protein